MFCVQNMASLSSYLCNQSGSSFLNYMADFHLLFYLYTSQELEVAGVSLKVSFLLPLLPPITTYSLLSVIAACSHICPSSARPLGRETRCWLMAGTRVTCGPLWSKWCPLPIPHPLTLHPLPSQARARPRRAPPPSGHVSTAPC